QYRRITTLCGGLSPSSAVCRRCYVRSIEIGDFFFSSRRRHTRSYGDWSSDVCSSDCRGAHHGGPVRHRDGAAVHLHRDGGCAIHRRRGSKVLVVYCVHRSASLVPYFTRARKSSLKCLRALWTGNGAMPPRPQSDPCTMVSQS